MKAKYFILSLFLIIVLNAQAQQQRPPFPQIEDMHNKKWEEISTKAKLSEKEKTAVRPIFLKHEEAGWDLSKQNREMFKAVRERKEGVPLNYEEINNKYVEQEVKQAELLKQYHKQLSSILSPETLFNYYRAERQYTRQLLKDAPTRPRN